MSVTPQQMQSMAGLARTGFGNNIYGQTAGGAADALGVVSGYGSGTTTGDVSGTANLLKLAGQNFGGANTSALGQLGVSQGDVNSINTGATGALDALAMYQGIKQGGWQGYGQATGAGLQGAGLLLDNPMLSTVGGYIMAPLAVYNAVKNWQSGNTGSDALQGAEAGAAVGSIIPGVGTLIGALAGGALGALSSAFGPGRADPETGDWNNLAAAYDTAKSQGATADQLNQVMAGLTPQQEFTGLAGVMDAKNNSPGHSEPIEQVFGRMGEGNLLNQMTAEANKAFQSGQITPGESIQDQWTKVINPWLQSKGASISPNAVNVKGQNEGQALTSDLQGLLSNWETGGITPNTVLGMQGQKDPSLTEYVGMKPTMVAAAKAQAQPVTWLANTAPNQQPGYLQATTGSPTPAGAPASMTYNPGITPGQPSMMPQASPYGWSHAEGGHMRKDKKSGALGSIYKPKLHRGVQYFDDGTDSSDFTSDDSSGGGGDTSTPLPGGSGSSAFDQLTGVNVPSSGAPALVHSEAGVNYYADGSSFDTNSGTYLGADGRIIQNGQEVGMSPAPGGGGSKMSQQLKNFGENATGGGGITGLLKVLAGIAPLGAALMRPHTNTSPPGAVPGMTQGAKNPNAPIGPGRTQVAPGVSGPSGSGGSGLTSSPLGSLSQTALTQGTGPTPQIGSPGSPSNLPGGAPMSLGDWYTYGSRPEATFFQNNYVPLAQATGVAQGQAKGGRSSPGGALSALQGEPDMPEFDSSLESHAQGPGDGTSDDIPAQLSDGEYVIDANTVSLLGNGSNKAGAARLDQLRENLRRHAAGPMARGKQFMKAKPPEAYMGRGKKGQK